MFAGFLLSLREGLEAALIVGVLLGVLDKMKRPALKRTVWSGTAAAVLLSVTVGWLLNLAGARFEGRAEEIFEGVAMLIAAGILTWTILWMRAQGRAITRQMETDAERAAAGDNRLGLFFIAFLAVFREGLELSIFLTALSIHAEISPVWIGALLGLLAVLVISVLIFRGLIRLNITQFFRVTTILLVIFAAGLTAHGVHELNEAGLIPPLVEHVWDVNHILDENSTTGQFLKVLVGYNGNPSLSEVIAYALYMITAVILLFRKPGPAAVKNEA